MNILNIKTAIVGFVAMVFAFGAISVFAQSPTTSLTVSPTTTPAETTTTPSPSEESGGESFTVTLQELNNSGVSGQATITVEGNVMTVSIQAEGLAPNNEHAQHIHGLTGGQDSSCATMDADENNDGILSSAESQTTAGAPVLDLEPFPTANGNGAIDFEQEYTGEVSSLMPLDTKVIELHGLSVDGEYQAETPVACGEIVSGSQGGSTPETSDTTTTDDTTTTMPNGAPNTGFRVM